MADVQILVIAAAPHGHVWVGWVSERLWLKGGALVLHRARTVRRWGTTAGIQQLANSGPTDRTELDDIAEADLMICQPIWIQRVAADPSLFGL